MAKQQYNKSHSDPYQIVVNLKDVSIGFNYGGFEFFIEKGKLGIYGREQLMDLLKRSRQTKRKKDELLELIKTFGEVAFNDSLMGIDTTKPLEERLDTDTKRLLGIEFFSSVKSGDFEYFHAYLDSGLPINLPHPKHEMTPLHLAAGTSRYFTRHLVNSGKCDYGLRDKWGRFAADVAVVGSGSQGVIRLLFKKTDEQLRKQHGLSIAEYEKKFPHPAKG